MSLPGKSLCISQHTGGGVFKSGVCGDIPALVHRSCGVLRQPAMIGLPELKGPELGHANV